jgi:hypothetical protein
VGDTVLMKYVMYRARAERRGRNSTNTETARAPYLIAEAPTFSELVNLHVLVSCCACNVEVWDAFPIC